MMGENAGGSVFLRAIILLRIRGGRGKALLGEAPAPPAVATEMPTIHYGIKSEPDAPLRSKAFSRAYMNGLGFGNQKVY